MNLRDIRTISLVAIAATATACADGTDVQGSDTGTPVEVDCQREQLDEFKDCNYGDFGFTHGAGPEENVRNFCKSSCSQVRRFYVHNTSFRDLSFAKGMTETTGPFKIAHNSELESLHGLEDVRVIGDNVSEIVSNSKLTSLKELSSLKHVRGGQFTIASSVFETLEGLESLERIDGWLVIQFNANLTDLRALESLEYIGGGLSVHNNEMLPKCEIQWLVDRVEIEGDVTTYNNGTETDADCS